MDAASAIIGFTASLTTLVGLVIESAKTLYKAQSHFKEAPRDIRRLSQQICEFEALLKEIQSQMNVERGSRASTIQALINTSAQHMQDDLQEFNSSFQKVKSILDESTTNRKLLGLRIRHILTESKVTRYQQLISSYSGTLTLFLALVNNTKLEQLSRQHISTKPHLEEHTSKQPRPAHKVLNCAANSVVREFKLLFGFIAFLKTISHANCPDRSGQRSAPSYYFTFIPPQWFSTLIVQWEFRLHYTNDSLPTLGISLSPIRHNSHPLLVKAIKSCDLVELQKLFRCGLAKANDYLLLRRRPILLLEAIASRSASCNPDNVLETYKYLLGEGLGADSVSVTSSHAQILINLAKSSKARLNSALNAFCFHDGSFFWSTYSEPSPEIFGRESNSTILSLIIRHGAGFSCLETHLFRQSEPWTTESISSIDRWLIGVLASVSPVFRTSLEMYLQSYKCIFSKTRTDRRLLQPFELSTIVSEVFQASNKTRIEFLKILTKWGTREMLRPFLSDGYIDLDESSANASFPRLCLSYLGKAVRWGNQDTFEYLLSLGACPIRGLNYMSRFPWVFPQDTENVQVQIKAMVLKMAGHALSYHINSHTDSMTLINHDSLLALLLRTSDLRKYSPQLSRQLIERLIESNVDQIVQSSNTVRNTYILSALVLNLPDTLQNFLSRTGTNNFCPFDLITSQFEGSSVVFKSYPSLDSFSWVSLAVDLALPECLQVLLGPWEPLGPTGLVGVTSRHLDLLNSGRYLNHINILKESLVEVDKMQQQRNYPRQAIALYTWPCQIPQRHVEQSEDEQIADLLKDWIGKFNKALAGKFDHNNLPNCIRAARTGMTPKIAKGKQTIVSSFIASVVQMLELQIWEVILLIAFYLLSVGLIVLSRR